MTVKHGNTLRLTAEEIKALHHDIRERIALQRIMAQHTNAVISMETGVDGCTMWKIENGVLPKTCFRRTTDEQVAEVLRRRAIWRLAREWYNNYTKPAICQRHGISETTMYRHVKLVRAWDRKTHHWRLAA